MANVWKPHATVAAVVEDQGRFLLVEECINGEVLYNQPAGHLDPGESLVDAVVRETREEAARKFHPEAVTGIYLWDQPASPRTFLRIAFCGPCSDHDPDQPLDTGIQRALWMTRDEILAIEDRMRSPLVLQCIDDYLAGRRYPLDMLSVIGLRHDPSAPATP